MSGEFNPGTADPGGSEPDAMGRPPAEAGPAGPDPGASAAGGLTLATLVDASTDIAATRSRLAKVRRLAGLFADVSPGDARLVAAYLSGVVPQGRLGIGWRGLAALPAPSPVPGLTVAEVDRVFSALAAASGSGSQRRRADLVTGLFAAATTVEQGFLRGLITGELRQGSLDAVMLQSLAAAGGVGEDEVRRAAMLAGSTLAVVEPALRGGSAALAAVSLRVGRPVRPMLAGSAAGIEEAYAGGVRERAVECKLDGIRIQAHRDGREVRLFTRSLEDITDRLPEVAGFVAGLAGDGFVLDGEVLALGPDGRPEPFQVTAARTARRGGRPAGADDPVAGPEDAGSGTALRAYFFDLLALDGRTLIDEPLSTRRAALAELLGDAHADALVPGIVTADPAAAGVFFDEVLASGHEGVVIKDLASAYAAGRRGRGWVKVKPRYTLDLAVLAVEWGSGRRAGMLSNIHLGARRSPDSGDFVMLGKTFKGMTDEILRWQTETFSASAVAREPWGVRLAPDHVVEIAFDGLQRSSRYPGGLALRFARVLRYRPDKSVREADTLETVRTLAARMAPRST